MALSALAFVSIAERSSFAQTSSSDLAREELKKGYELKKAGHCDQAMAHLQESVRLDPEIKALANLAECEETLGKVVIAGKHWRSVQQLAAVGANAAIEADAEKHVADVTARAAAVTVHVAVDAPQGTQVTLDDAPLASADLAAPIAVDPGKHTFVARAGGREPGTVIVELAPGQKKEIVVAPAPATAAQSAGPPASTRGADPPAPTPPQATPASGVPWKPIGLVTAVAGVVGLGVGAVFGIEAMSDKSSAHCNGTTCASAGSVSELTSAQSAGTTSTIFFLAGGALAAAGATIWLLAPSSVQVSPALGSNGAGLSLRTRW